VKSLALNFNFIASFHFSSLFANEIASIPKGIKAGDLHKIIIKLLIAAEPCNKEKSRASNEKKVHASFCGLRSRLRNCSWPLGRGGLPGGVVVQATDTVTADAPPVRARPGERTSHPVPGLGPPARSRPRRRAAQSRARDHGQSPCRGRPRASVTPAVAASWPLRPLSDRARQTHVRVPVPLHTGRRRCAPGEKSAALRTHKGGSITWRERG
jgi:hypothetical protein